MVKSDLAKFAKTAQAKIVKHSPEILTAIGVVGIFSCKRDP